jgi:membrane fusion protein, multidrug efflux system
MRKNHRLVLATALVVCLGALGAGTYLITDGRAKEARKAPKGPPAVPVTVAAAESQTVPVRLQAIGNVEPHLTVAIKARVDGEIVAVNFKEGQEVRKNQVLFRIDSRPYVAALRQAEANALRDAAARDHALAQEKRYQELLQKNFISKDAYAQFRTNAQTADAVAKASEAALQSARLNVEYCTIASPIDGVPGRVLLQAGNLVKANDVNPLVVINEVRPIYVNFGVPEQQLAPVRDYMEKGPLTVEATIAGAKTRTVSGRLIFVDNAVDPSTGTIRMRAEYPNEDATLWPGQFVNVSIRLYDEANAILIPAGALQTAQEGQFVYVIGKDNAAQVRKITVERTEGDRAVVKGLAKGELVVTRGALRLAPGMKVQVRADFEAS